MIATDFDREGELIGLEALGEVLDVNPELKARVGDNGAVKRARYSALTKDEIERAFANLEDLSYELAYAGEARQDIDLIWGATLTRAVSLATRRFGSNFLSVGRVQSPTLGLIVERELEVFRLLGRGLSNQEITRELWISESTVKTHETRVFAKLGLRDRAQAVVLAYESGTLLPGHDRA